jgi:hypothetical protein
VEIPRPWQRLVEPNFILNAISQVLDVGADALDLALDQVKSQAVEVVDKIDEDIQTKVTERAKASTKSLIRTTLFSLFPLLVLVGLQQLIQH